MTCWCCTAAAVAPLALRKRLLPPKRTNSNGEKLLCFCQFCHETYPRLKNAFFDVRIPRNISLGPLGPPSIQTTVVIAVKRVLTLLPTEHPFSYPAGFRGACTLRQHNRLNWLPWSLSGELVPLLA